LSFLKFFVADPDPGYGAHNGGVMAQNEALEVLVDQWSQILITLMRSRIRLHSKVKSWIRARIWIRIEVKSWIRFHIEVMRIRNPSNLYCVC
jgi:hypothetical protein